MRTSTFTDLYFLSKTGVQKGLIIISKLQKRKTEKNKHKLQVSKRPVNHPFKQRNLN